jgi:hypothetical protein
MVVEWPPAFTVPLRVAPVAVMPVVVPSVAVGSVEVIVNEGVFVALREEIEEESDSQSERFGKRVSVKVRV